MQPNRESQSQWNLQLDPTRARSSGSHKKLHITQHSLLPIIITDSTSRRCRPYSYNAKDLIEDNRPWTTHNVLPILERDSTSRPCSTSSCDICLQYCNGAARFYDCKTSECFQCIRPILRIIWHCAIHKGIEMCRIHSKFSNTSNL